MRSERNQLAQGAANRRVVDLHPGRSGRNHLRTLALAGELRSQ
jgi:hypothetical protein